MLSTRNGEEKALTGFYQCWNRPLNDIIEGFYNLQPDCIHLLTLRARKNLPSDAEVIEEKQLFLSEKNQLSKEDQILSETLKASQLKLYTVSTKNIFQQLLPLYKEDILKKLLALFQQGEQTIEEQELLNLLEIPTVGSPEDRESKSEELQRERPLFEDQELLNLLGIRSVVSPEDRESKSENLQRKRPFNALALQMKIDVLWMKSALNDKEEMLLDRLQSFAGITVANAIERDCQAFQNFFSYESFMIYDNSIKFLYPLIPTEDADLNEKDLYYLFASANLRDVLGIHLTIPLDFINNRLNKIAKHPLLKSLNPGLQYLEAMRCEWHAPLVKEDFCGISFEFRPDPNPAPDDMHTALELYRGSVLSGSELGLTGLARMYALGLAGLTQDLNFAVELYQLAIAYGVIGAVPCEHPHDLRILFYSVVASGMHISREGAPTALISRVENPLLSNITTFRYTEIDWITRINKTLPGTQELLKKFREFALKNTDGLFDKMLDALPNAEERLELCLEGEDFKRIMERKTKHYSERKNIFNSCTFFPPVITNLIFDFETQECFHLNKRLI